jgi:hypothetical protein
MPLIPTNTGRHMLKANLNSTVLNGVWGCRFGYGEEWWMDMDMDREVVRMIARMCPPTNNSCLYGGSGYLATRSRLMGLQRLIWRLCLHGLSTDKCAAYSIGTFPNRSCDQRNDRDSAFIADSCHNRKKYVWLLIFALSSRFSRVLSPRWCDELPYGSITI